MAQLTLIPDPKPLDRHLGKEFFQKAPRRPGVYLMRDASDKIVYVGKAKNLRQRLNHYRLANPDRMPRRHLRMVREVKRIEFQFCANEADALKRESKLLLELRPKFNRAGVWRGAAKFLSWRENAEQLEMVVNEVPRFGWLRVGPLGGGAIFLQQSLARLIWLATNTEREISEMPAGWIQGNFMREISIGCGGRAGEAARQIESFFIGESVGFLNWIAVKLTLRTNSFERSVILTELETLTKFSERWERTKGDKQQLALI